MNNVDIEKLRQEIREEVTAEVLVKYNQAFSELDAQIRIVNEKSEMCDNLIRSCINKIAVDRALAKAEEEMKANSKQADNQ